MSATQPAACLLTFKETHLVSPCCLLLAPTRICTHIEPQRVCGTLMTRTGSPLVPRARPSAGALRRRGPGSVQAHVQGAPAASGTWRGASPPTHKDGCGRDLRQVSSSPRLSSSTATQRLAVSAACAVHCWLYEGRCTESCHLRLCVYACSILLALVHGNC